MDPDSSEPGNPPFIFACLVGPDSGVDPTLFGHYLEVLLVLETGDGVPGDSEGGNAAVWLCGGALWAA